MRAAPESAPVGLRERGSQLVFLGGALECFRRVLDPINDSIVSLDRHQANDLVLAARSVVLHGPFEIDKLADCVFVHQCLFGEGRFGPCPAMRCLARGMSLGYGRWIAYCHLQALFRLCPADFRRSRDKIGSFGPNTKVSRSGL